ncbi:MAG TPA: GtrA family protein, partial [Candidatus Saccharimonadales bacterium]|nr:GtrA family protein [Candidatus Saccharimonadales bacterium]
MAYLSSIQLVRYLISGLTAFATEYTTFLVLHSGLDMQLGAAHVVSFSAGLLVSFTLQRQWSFGAERYKLSQPQQFTAHASLAAFNLLFTGLV